MYKADGVRTPAVNLSANHDQGIMSFSTPVNTDHLGARDSKQALQSSYENTSGLQSDLTDLENRLTGEININSILALDEQIREHERTVIRLRRTRNSLLNVSKLPPEVLGKIFRWNVTYRGDFCGLEERSHNFLLVCHHWFQVALCTPEIWSFWGNDIKDWTRWYPYSRTAPLDLVLYCPIWIYYDPNVAMGDELQDRATRDTIRRVHLRATDPALLNFIISSLTVKCEGTRSNSVESFVLQKSGNGPVDVSGFFAHYRFPKLRHLNLTNCAISSWDHLTSRTRALTVLDLSIRPPSPTPTTSQLLSILSSNPLLQKIRLSEQVIPRDDGGTSSVGVSLYDLKEVELTGDVRDVIRLLYRLDHPRRMDNLTLTLKDRSIVETSQLIGPLLRDYLRSRGRSQHGLGLLLSDFSLHVGDVRGINPLLQRMDTFLVITMPRGDAWDRTILDLIAHAEGEEVVHFQSLDDYGMRSIYPQFPNLRALSFAGGDLWTMFPEPDLGRDKETLTSLQHISLQALILDRDDWSPLITFLAYRVSSGNQLDTVEISDSSYMRPEVMEVVGGMVRELGFDRQRPIRNRDR